MRTTAKPTRPMQGANSFSIFCFCNLIIYESNIITR